MKNWQRQVIHCILFLILLFASVSMVKAKEFPTSAGIGGDHITWTYDAENKTMTFTGYGETYGIGGWIEGEALKNDYGDWYALKDKVEKVVLGEGITEIHSQAFLECSNLKEVEFPSTLKKIGSRAFEGCGVETLTFPPALKKIEMGAFRACRVETLVIPSTLSEIGEDAFCSSYIRKIMGQSFFLWGNDPVHAHYILIVA